MKGLLAFSLFGLTVLNVIYVAAIMNYAVQSEMMISLLYSIYGLVESSLFSNEDLEQHDQGNGQSRIQQHIMVWNHILMIVNKNFFCMLCDSVL